MANGSPDVFQFPLSFSECLLLLVENDAIHRVECALLCHHFNVKIDGRGCQL